MERCLIGRYPPAIAIGDPLQRSLLIKEYYMIITFIHNGREQSIVRALEKVTKAVASLSKLGCKIEHIELVD